MKSKYCPIIAIDGDVDKSGVFTLYPDDRTYTAEALAFPHLLRYLKATKEAADHFGDSAIIVVEAGWLNQSNWHINSNPRTAAAIGNATGRNHEVGRKIVECCKYFGLEVIEQKPLSKCWKGKDRKITLDEINQILANLGMEQLKTKNQEILDATLLAINFANLPIKLSAR